MSDIANSVEQDLAGKTHWTSGEIERQVRAKFPSPAYVVLTELRDGTGYLTRGREADAVAFGLWPSRGLDIVGFEFKSQRHDWQRELINPEKAESIASYCDEWYIVAHESVVKSEEVPSAWGWYAPGPKGLRCMKVAVREPARVKEIGRPFLMAIMRKLDASYVPSSKIHDMVEERAVTVADERAEINLRRLQRAEELEQILAKFKESSGLDLGREYGYPKYDPRVLGVIAKLLAEGTLDHHLHQIEAAADHVHQALATLRGLPFPNPGAEPKKRRMR